MIWCAVLVLLVYFTSTTVRAFYRLRHIPGAASAGFSKWWFLKVTVEGRIHIRMHEASDRYGKQTHVVIVSRTTDALWGSLIRIGPNELATSNSDDWRKILGVKSNYTRTEWYKSFQIYPGRDNIISQRDEALHKITRAKMSAGVRSSRLPVLRTISWSQSDSLSANYFLSTPARRTSSWNLPLTPTSPVSSDFWKRITCQLPSNLFLSTWPNRWCISL